MALLDYVLNGGNLVTGLVVGAGRSNRVASDRAALLPIAETAIKGRLIAYREAERLYNEAANGITELAEEVQRNKRDEAAMTHVN